MSTQSNFEQQSTAWRALEAELSPVFQELASVFGYSGGVLSRFHVRMGYRLAPVTFADYRKAVAICVVHGYEAFGRPTSRDGIHYDNTAEGTVTVVLNGEYYDLCMAEDC